MAEIVSGVHRLGTELVNYYLVEEGGRCTLVDAALPRYHGGLVRALQAMGTPLDAIDAVVLTHAHVDHIGMAERLRTEAGATVYVHGADAEMARTAKQPKRDASFLPYLVKPTALKLMAHIVANGGGRPTKVAEVTTYSDGEVLDVPGHPRVVATPGHTDGHCSIVLDRHGVLITGDAMCSRNPLTGREGPQVMPSAFNTSTSRAIDSLELLAALDAQHVLFGHGDPWDRGARAAVERARELGPS